MINQLYSEFRMLIQNQTQDSRGIVTVKFLLYTNTILSMHAWIQFHPCRIFTYAFRMFIKDPVQDSHRIVVAKFDRPVYLIIKKNSWSCGKRSAINNICILCVETQMNIILWKNHGACWNSFFLYTVQVISSDVQGKLTILFLCYSGTLKWFQLRQKLLHINHLLGHN